jgi:hypothetical protein
VQALSQDYPKARVIFIGFEWDVRKTFARRGGDLTRVVEIPPSPTTSEDALHSAALLKQSPVKGGFWSPKPFICRAPSDAFGLPDFRWNRIQ